MCIYIVITPLQLLCHSFLKIRLIILMGSCVGDGVQLKVQLSGDVGLDAPSCRCILTLLSSISEVANFIPSRVLSQAQLIKQVAHQEHPVWTADTICQDDSINLERKNLPQTDSLNYKKRVETLLESTIRSVWNIKNMLRHEMVSSMKQMLR